MKVIFYSTTDELRQILRARLNPNLPAALILPRGWAWLLVEPAGGKTQTMKEAV